MPNALRLNDIVPDFTAITTMGEISFHDWIGDGYAILFSHPKDFTPVCTTELGAMALLEKEWAARRTRVMGISIDSVESHHAWLADVEKVGGTPVNYPVIADEDLTVSKAFGMLPANALLPDGRTAEDTQTVRSVFIIGPDKRLRLSMSYPMQLGRNFAEILRVLDALILSDRHEVATPANWRPGEDVVIRPSVPDDKAAEMFGSYDARTPYLRYAKAPKG